jgi:hypothetical protein
MYTKYDAEMLRDIFNEYTDSDGKNFDNDALYKSFNSAEKESISVIEGINKDLSPKAEYTSTVIRGKKFEPFFNYIHRNVLRDTDSTEVMDALTKFANKTNVSTKAGTGIERTTVVSPLDFDVYATTERGANQTLMDYHFTSPIRTGRMTLSLAKKNKENKYKAIELSNIFESNDKKLNKDGTVDYAGTIAALHKDGKISDSDLELMKKYKSIIFQKEEVEAKTEEEIREEMDVLSAINKSFDKATRDFLESTHGNVGFAAQIAQFIKKQAYRIMLAALGRTATEYISNLGAVLFIGPLDFISGMKHKKFILSPNFALFLKNIKTKQGSRLSPSNSISGRMIDTDMLRESTGNRDKAKSNIGNVTNKLWNVTGKPVSNVTALTADTVISTPDKIVMQPYYMGTFESKFKELTGVEPNFEKIALNDEAYMRKFSKQINDSMEYADEMSVILTTLLWGVVGQVRMRIGLERSKNLIGS